MKNINCKKYGLRQPDHELGWYDTNQLTKGIVVEFEHLEKEITIDNIEKSMCITMHHLDEVPKDYYTKLALIDPHN